MPSSQYYLKAENSDILQIDNDYDLAYARKMGRTKVFLHDKNVREEYSVILPSATVNVHEVAKISLSVLPNRNWGLVLGHTHEIIVELYDRCVYYLNMSFVQSILCFLCTRIIFIAM